MKLLLFWGDSPCAIGCQPPLDDPLIPRPESCCKSQPQGVIQGSCTSSGGNPSQPGWGCESMKNQTPLEFVGWFWLPGVSHVCFGGEFFYVFGPRHLCKWLKDRILNLGHFTTLIWIRNLEPKQLRRRWGGVTCLSANLSQPLTPCMFFHPHGQKKATGYISIFMAFGSTSC